MVENDEVDRALETDAAALRGRTRRGLPPLSATERMARGAAPRPAVRTAWRPRAVVTVGALAAVLLLVIGAVASERFRRLLIPTRGRSAADIQSDIRGGLAGEGFESPRVSVERTPGSLSIDVTAGDSSGLSLETAHRIVGGDNVDSTFILQLPDFRDLDHLPLPERRRAIERRLAERGIRATVTIDDGKLRIDADERRIEREK
jgi:hypothetical protein